MDCLMPCRSANRLLSCRRETHTSHFLCGPFLLSELLKASADTRGLVPDVQRRDNFNGTGLNQIAGSGLPCL